jgi:hypothetical protein
MRSTSLFAGIHLAGNALLLWLGYYWLGLGESRAGALLWSLAVAAVVGCGACWLYGAGFAFFAGRRVGAAFLAALRNLAPLVVAAIVVVVVYALLARARDAMDNPGFRLASWLTLTLRKPVKPATVQAIFHAVFWVLRWVVVPVLILPVGPAIVSRGWAGFGAVAVLAGSAGAAAGRGVGAVEAGRLGAAHGQLRRGDDQFRGPRRGGLLAVRGGLAGAGVRVARRKRGLTPFFYPAQYRAFAVALHQAGDGGERVGIGAAGFGGVGGLA